MTEQHLPPSALQNPLRTIFVGSKPQDPHPPASSGPRSRCSGAGWVSATFPGAASGDGARIPQRWIVPGDPGACPRSRCQLGGTQRCWGSQRVGVGLHFVGVGCRQRASRLRRFRSASPVLPRSLPRVMSPWFGGPPRRLPGPLAAGWPRSQHGDTKGRSIHGHPGWCPSFPQG